MAKSADDYYRTTKLWRDEQRRLRDLLRNSGLTETIKWGGPCYTYKGKNVVGIGAFKSYFGLWFHQGALLADKHNVLINAQEGKTRAQRQWRMHAANDIKPAIIRRYVSEACANVDAGKEIKADRSQVISVPQELRTALRRHKGAAAAFRALRKGLQREYCDYIAAAKREDTKARRIDKILPMIVAGKGLNDKYR